MVDIACDLCRPKPAGKGHSGTLCIIAMGNGLEAVSADIWLSTLRARCWQKLVALSELLDASHCSKATLVFGGHGHWNGFQPFDFEYIIEDVLHMGTSLGINMCSGAEPFLSPDGRNPIAEGMYDSDNHFKGTARDIVIAWLEDVLSYAEDLDPRDVLPSPPPVAAAVAAEDLAHRMDLPPAPPPHPEKTINVGIMDCHPGCDQAATCV